MIKCLTFSADIKQNEIEVFCDSNLADDVLPKNSEITRTIDYLTELLGIALRDQIIKNRKDKEGAK